MAHVDHPNGGGAQRVLSTQCFWLQPQIRLEPSSVNQNQMAIYLHKHAVQVYRVFRLSRALSSLGGPKIFHLLGPSTFLLYVMNKIRP